MNVLIFSYLFVGNSQTYFDSRRRQSYLLDYFFKKCYTYGLEFKISIYQMRKIFRITIHKN